VVIDSENRVDLGGNLGGLWLKETWLFVSTLTETQATFVVGQTLGTNLVSPCISCIYFPLHVLCSPVLEFYTQGFLFTSILACNLFYVAILVA
jgi:hypothetical protein